jgi:chorismate-pyruvate lyase
MISNYDLSLFQRILLSTDGTVTDLAYAGEPIRHCAEIAQYFDLTTSEPLVSRTYLIHHGGKRLGMISEKWPLGYFR